MGLDHFTLQTRQGDQCLISKAGRNQEQKASSSVSCVTIWRRGDSRSGSSELSVGGNQER